MSLTKTQQAILLAFARESIIQAFISGKPLQIRLDEHPPELTVPGASFVRLEHRQKLRGCSIAMPEAVRPLLEDVAENAFAAAFCDRHFLPLAYEEVADLELHIAILSPVEELTFGSESELIAQLRPNNDGLLLKEDSHRATFLPSAWENLPVPMQFLQHLKQEAGLPASYWSDSLKAYRYTAESIG